MFTEMIVAVVMIRIGPSPIEESPAEPGRRRSRAGSTNRRSWDAAILPMKLLAAPARGPTRKVRLGS
jgi:hypothetical protein